MEKKLLCALLVMLWTAANAETLLGQKSENKNSDDTEESTPLEYSTTARSIKRTTKIWWIAPRRPVPLATKKPIDPVQANESVQIKNNETPVKPVTKPTRIWWISVKPSNLKATNLNADKVLKNVTGSVKEDLNKTGELLGHKLNVTEDLNVENATKPSEGAESNEIDFESSSEPTETNKTTESTTVTQSKDLINTSPPATSELNQSNEPVTDFASDNETESSNQLDATTVSIDKVQHLTPEASISSNELTEAPEATSFASAEGESSAGEGICDAFDSADTESSTEAETMTESNEPSTQLSTETTNEATEPQVISIEDTRDTTVQPDVAIKVTEPPDVTTELAIDDTTDRLLLNDSDVTDLPETATEIATELPLSEQHPQLPYCPSYANAFCATIQMGDDFRCICLGNDPINSREAAQGFCRNFSHGHRPPMKLISFATEDELVTIGLTFSLICPECRMWTAATCDRHLVRVDPNNPNLFILSSFDYFWNSPWDEPVKRSLYCSNDIRPDDCGAGSYLFLSTTNRFCLEQIDPNNSPAFPLCV